MPHRQSAYHPLKISSAHHQRIISESSVYHQHIISLSSAHHEHIISASSAHNNCIISASSLGAHGTPQASRGSSQVPGDHIQTQSAQCTGDHIQTQSFALFTMSSLFVFSLLVCLYIFAYLHTCNLHTCIFSHLHTCDTWILEYTGTINSINNIDIIGSNQTIDTMNTIYTINIFDMLKSID